MIFVGIDDTDVKDSPGTNKLARHLIANLGPDLRCVVAIRHQLLFDPRIPYTSKNSSASILIDPAAEPGTVPIFVPRKWDCPPPRSLPADPETVPILSLTDTLRRLIRAWFVAGSDPGLCVTEHVPEEITAFGRRCQQEVVTQQEARALAARHGIHLEGLGGSEDGVIGALAAVGLAAGGDDGRVVNIAHFADDLSGPQDVALLHARGVAEIRSTHSGQLIETGRVDIGKHLRPNYRGRRIVLFVEPAPPDPAQTVSWRAVRAL